MITSAQSKRQLKKAGVIFDNLTKFIVWTLPTNLGELIVEFEKKFRLFAGRDGR